MKEREYYQNFCINCGSDKGELYLQNVCETCSKKQYFQNLNYSNIILKPKKSIIHSRSECDITAKLGDKVFASPVCPANMLSILNPQICKIFDDNNWFYVYHRINGIEDIKEFVWNANKERIHKSKNQWNIISISIGITDDYMSLLKNYYNTVPQEYQKIDYITIDIAHGHTERIKPFVDFIKSKMPKTYLIAGNGCTGEYVEFLEGLGVDCAKIGIGVSQSCRTRQYTGFGSNTVSSLIECKQAAKNIKLMSDGGLTIVNNEVHIGDVAKAIKCGADFVMSGALFSRCLDSPSIIDGYFGNASARAKEHSHHIEGTTVKIETNGLKIIEMIKLISDSLKSSLSYAGGSKLEDLRKVEYNIIK